MLETDNLNINNGIFQGVSFSSLLFCISQISVSIEPKNTDYGWKTKIITHLLYMDDSKWLCKKWWLLGFSKHCKRFSDKICLQFGLENVQKAR